MPLRAVFFDLDDTLCDTTGSRQARAQRAFACLCQDNPHLDTDSLIASALETNGQRLVRGVPTIIKELGLADTEAGKKAIDIWFFGGCIELLQPRTDVLETLEVLARDYVLGVITNGDEGLQRRKFAHLGFAPYVRHLIISSAVGHEKPDPRIFQHALSLANVEPSAAVFVGDRLDVDIAGAKSAGMRAIWYNYWGGSLDVSTHLPDAIIERFTDLPAALRTVGAIVQ